MNRLMVKALVFGITTALAAGVSGCNRSADAGTSTAAPMAAATNAPADDLAAGGAAADNAAVGDARGADSGVRYAKVVSVDPVRESVNNPKQVCRDEVVSHTEPPKDQHRIAGTAIGAVVGGLVGNQVGGGSGKTLATVAGAVGGGYAGNRIEASRQRAQVTSSVQRHCSTVNRSSDKVVGYDVRYVYNGVTRTVRMDHDPGDRVQVQEGVIAVSDAR